MGIWNFDPKFGMKVSIYLTWNKKKSEFFSLDGLRAMTVQVIRHFGPKHKWSIYGMKGWW